MKKIIIGAFVGGIILFIWQFLSWTALNWHEAQQRYTPKQDSILAYLGTQFSEDGAYMMPSFPQGATREEMEKQMKLSEGKPWAQVIYHKSMPAMNKMYMNMGRSLLTNITILLLLCWLITKINAPSFGTVFMGTLGAGLISFLNGPYTMHIWYHSFDLMANFADTLVAFGATGLWLAWWLRHK
jgi:hypothetical protein